MSFTLPIWISPRQIRYIVTVASNSTKYGAIAPIDTSRAVGAILMLVQASAHVEEILRITRLDQIFGLTAILKRGYHSQTGTYGNTGTRIKSFDVARSDIEASVEAFAIRDRMAKSNSFTMDEIDAIMKDLAMLFGTA